MSDEEDINSQGDEGQDYGEDEEDPNQEFEQEEEEEDSEIREQNMDEESQNQGKGKIFKRGEGTTTPFLTK